MSWQCLVSGDFINNTTGSSVVVVVVVVADIVVYSPSLQLFSQGCALPHIVGSWTYRSTVEQSR